MKVPARVQVSDQTTMKALESVREAFLDLSRNPLIGASLITGVELPDATEVHVAHQLKKKYSMVLISPPSGPSTSGRVEELVSHDPSSSVLLKASGYGATVTVTVMVI